MRTHHTITLLAAGALLALTGCADPDADHAGMSDEGKASPSTSSPSAAPRSVDPDAARAAAGLPAEPKGAARQAFIDGLNAIDKDIVHGKDDKAISRGIDTCSAIKNHPGDKAKQIEQTNKRWTSPTHPEGHGLTKAAQILDVAHKNVCPTY